MTGHKPTQEDLLRIKNLLNSGQRISPKDLSEALMVFPNGWRIPYKDNALCISKESMGDSACLPNRVTCSYEGVELFRVEVYDDKYEYPYKDLERDSNDYLRYHYGPWVHRVMKQSISERLRQKRTLDEAEQIEKEAEERAKKENFSDTDI